MAELLQVVAERGTLRIFSVEMEAAERRMVLAPKLDTANGRCFRGFTGCGLD